MVRILTERFLKYLREVDAPKCVMRLSVILVDKTVVLNLTVGQIPRVERQPCHIANRVGRGVTEERK